MSHYNAEWLLARQPASIRPYSLQRRRVLGKPIFDKHWQHTLSTFQFLDLQANVSGSPSWKPFTANFSSEFR
jgi:hypothetical protein